MGEGVGGAHRRADESAGAFAQRPPAYDFLERSVARLEAASIRIVAQAVSDLACCPMSTFEDLAVDHKPRFDARTETDQEPDLAAGERAPADLSQGSGVDVIAHGDGCHAKALAQEGRQVKIAPAGNIGREQDALILDDPRGDGTKPGATAFNPLCHPARGPDCPLYRLGGPAARVSLDPLGQDQLTVEVGGAHVDLRAAEVQCKNERDLISIVS